MNYYQRYIDKLKSKREFKPMIFLDMEFGIAEITKELKNGKTKNYNDNFIFKIGLIHITSNETNIYSKFIKPRYRNFDSWKINDAIQDIVGFSENEVNKYGINFRTYYQHFKKYYKRNKTLIAVWGMEDIRLWKLYCQQLNLPYLIKDKDVIDVSVLFHQTYDLSMAQLYSLEKSIKYLNIPISNKVESHEPIADSFMTFLVFQQMIKNENIEKLRNYLI